MRSLFAIRLLIISSYRMFDAESTETIPYCLEPMDDNPGCESASESSHTELQAVFAPGQHSPANHKRRCYCRQGGRGQGRYIGRGCGRPGWSGAGPRGPWYGGSVPIHGCGGRGLW